MSTFEQQAHIAEQSQTEVYEAPRVESVVTAEELEREVFYAGQIPFPSGTA